MRAGRKITKSIPDWAYVAGGATAAVGLYALVSGRVAWAYERGVPTGLILLRKVQGHLLSLKVAAAFERMAAHAARDGVQLKITSGFRTMPEQLRLWLASKIPGANFVAARPGFSNHQNGRAIDISVGGNNPHSREYTWLARHARAYGFVNTGKNYSKVEYWHWEFTPSVA